MADKGPENEAMDRAAPRVQPSEFLRGFRPEYYSDTKKRPDYSLTASSLEYCLETITARNQTHDFEIFCRKLCERAICPNLRPQTGPDGGGDSKADTETFAVADEISNLTYISEANSGNEKWAFAFSAKARWAQKVRDDVAGLISTGRNYDRIICVTSRFAKAKTRAALEDELSQKHSIPITIHDRSWIVNETIAKDRTDLAFNYLKVGNPPSNDARLGPKDYSRSQQLVDIEKAIDDPDAFKGMELQLVSEALVAAKLSRSLERPRTETDGRFARAVRVANKHGVFRQKLEARYEQIRTAFWWFDDFSYLNETYSEFESLAINSDHSKNLELLGNVNQLLFVSIIHGHLSPEECAITDRTDRLIQALTKCAKDTTRPNNSLEAEAALLRCELNKATAFGTPDALPTIWQKFSEVLKKAKGLGEFDADALASIIEISGQIAGNDSSYNNLVEDLAEFVSSRKSEGEGALVLLKRAQKLDLTNKYDIIRLLGKATVNLTKREYSNYLIEATLLLAVAYKSAGLLWAARASCSFAAACVIISGEEDSELPVTIFPTMKTWAWIALELGHLPDFLYGFQLINGCASGLPLTEESEKLVAEDLQMLDAALGSIVLNLQTSELKTLENVPDTLEAIGLFVSRTCVLFSLGYEDELRADGSIPQQETKESAIEFLSLLKSQPAGEEFCSPLILNADERQIFTSRIIGMRIEIEIGTRDYIVIAECILGALEAFFATVIEKSGVPHAECFRIQLHESDEAEPDIEIKEIELTLIVKWPRKLKPSVFNQQRKVQDLLTMIAAHVMGSAFIFKDSNVLLEDLYTDAAVHHRMMMIAVASNSFHRVTSQNYLDLSHWEKIAKKSYPNRNRNILIPRIHLKTKLKPQRPSSEEGNDFEASNHRDVNIKSVIDVHAWEKAKWRGCGYLTTAGSTIPFMAFLFEDQPVAEIIFERWITRFGQKDADDEILISIVTDLPNESPHHYCVQVASNPTNIKNGKPTVVGTRSMTMTPPNGDNLARFLSAYRRVGSYCLIPGSGLLTPSFSFNLAIEKQKLAIKRASEVNANDIEAASLRTRGIKLASDA